MSTPAVSAPAAPAGATVSQNGSVLSPAPSSAASLSANPQSSAQPAVSQQQSGVLPSTTSSTSSQAGGAPVAQRTAGLRRTRRWRPPSSGTGTAPATSALAPERDEGAVPLEAVTIRAAIHDYSATVTVQQTYVNTEDDPIEVRYVFPLDEGAAVCAFEAVLDTQRISGVVHERKDDKSPAAAGKPALEPESPDVFVSLLGNLLPGKRCTISITYVAELATSRGIIRFILPTSVAPRYSSSSNGVSSGNRRPTSGMPYRLMLRVDVVMPSDLRRITSSSHEIAIETRAAHRAVVTLRGDNTQLEQDFVLLVEQTKPFGSRALLERWAEAESNDGTNGASSPKADSEKAAAAENKDSVALQVTFCEPFMEAKDVKDSDTRAELIFLVDTSSSMAGSRLEHTKLALRAFLSALPRRAKFNIFQFNRHYSSLFPTSQDVTTDTLRTAGDYITALNYDYGTEILGPLRAIFGLPHFDGYARQLFVLTDGEVAQPELSISLTKQHSETTRLFCYGVGSSVSTALVQGLARAGGGEASFIAHNSQIASTIAASLAAAIQPAISSITMDWSAAYVKDGEGKGAVSPTSDTATAANATSTTSAISPRHRETRIQHCPRSLPPVYPGSRHFVYGLMSRGGATIRDTFDVTIRAMFSNGGMKVFTVPVTLERQSTNGRMIHTLAARARLRELENTYRSDTNAAMEMVGLSCRYQLSSPLASFVAVPHGASPTSAPSAKPVPRAAAASVGQLTDQMGGLRVSSGQPAPGTVTATPNNSQLGTGGSTPAASSTAAAAPAKRPAISYAAERVIGNGSFGVVYQATVLETGEVIAIKKVLQDRRFKNRELAIMGMLDHPTVITLKHCFYSKGDKPDEVFLNLVMEFIPETIHRTLRTHTKAKKLIPLINTKLYMYQLCRGLSYLHSLGICHRDIKPQNLLLDTRTHHVKICDFGSAKILVRGETNVAYICSRYYRAPELVFEATDYTTTIDIWSLGCVFAELLLGSPLCPGDSSVDQLIEIIKVLGTPTREEVLAMNPHQSSFKFPQIAAQPWNKVFRGKAPADAIDLVSQFLRYDPKSRLDPFDALCHPFFDELRSSAARLPNAKPLPNIFNFVDSELTLMVARGHTRKLCPPDLVKKFQALGKLPKTV